jgi:ketosteroid isomerase-like protein
MSQENVEVVRALYQAWNNPAGGDPLEFIADDFEWVNPAYAVEPGTRHGREGWTDALQSGAAAFQYATHEPVEVRDLGERVLGFTTFTATTADGQTFTQDEQHLWTLREGKVIRFQWFHDRREAMHAAGLAD